MRQIDLLYEAALQHDRQQLAQAIQAANIGVNGKRNDVLRVLKQLGE